MLGAIETGDKTGRAGKPEPVDNLLTGQVIGGGGERNARHVGKTLRYHRQPDIFRTKVMAPLRYAVRLVDREQGDPCAGQHREASRGQQSLRGDVEQIEVAGEQASLDRGRIVPRERGVQHRRIDAGVEQSRDLVAHQRDQR